MYVVAWKVQTSQDNCSVKEVAQGKHHWYEKPAIAVVIVGQHS